MFSTVADKDQKRSAILGNFQKAYEEGVYGDTYQNRKLGRVGKKYEVIENFKSKNGDVKDNKVYYDGQFLTKQQCQDKLNFWDEKRKKVSTFKATLIPKQNIKIYQDLISKLETSKPKDPEFTFILHERPDMENPVYRINTGEKTVYVQRQDEMNSGYGWYQVEFTGKYWDNIKRNKDIHVGIHGQDILLGYTKEEVISYLK